MELNQLIFNLKHGTRYVKTLEDGSQTQVLEAPNKYMLQASRVIERIVNDNNALIKQVLQLQALLEKATNDSNQAEVQHQPGFSQHGPSAGPGTANSGSSAGQDDAGVNSASGT